MIAVLRAAERRHSRRGKLDIWSTFGADGRADARPRSFGALAAFDELRFPPGGVCTPRRRDGAETITYVYRGALAQESAGGCSAVLHAGEFHRMTAGRGVRHKEANASPSDWLHVFRISVGPIAASVDCALEQRRFAAAQRRNALCVIASPDGRDGSLHLIGDVVVYSSLLDPGRHLVHELKAQRRAWVHLVRGEAIMDDIFLTAGDGIGVAIAPAVSLTVQEAAEILLIDVGPAPGAPSEG
jgi:redox-sensitive bicupin YhaK (pirin superfamily)